MQTLYNLGLVCFPAQVSAFMNTFLCFVRTVWNNERQESITRITLNIKKKQVCYGSVKKYLNNAVIKTRYFWLSPYSTTFFPSEPRYFPLPVGNNSKDYQYKLVLVKLETTRDQLQNYYYKAAGLLLVQLYCSRLQIVLCLFNVTRFSNLYQFVHVYPSTAFA